MSECVNCGRDNRNGNDICTPCEEDIRRVWAEDDAAREAHAREQLNHPTGGSNG